jgi:hypothetical protein
LGHGPKEPIFLCGQSTIILCPNNEIGLLLLTPLEHLVIVGIPISKEYPTRSSWPQRHLTQGLGPPL